jgi:phage shock protein PspC (stress-responsive transcriptional regulator)
LVNEAHDRSMNPMTDNEFRNPLPPPVPPGPPARHLYRSVEKKGWLGVAKGLAEYTGAPVGVLRAAFVLLSFAGGLGLFAYLAAAALIPKIGEVNSLGDRISGGRPDRLLAAIAGIAVAAYAFFNGGSFDLLAVAVLASAGYYLWTKDRPAAPGPSVAGRPTWPQPVASSHFSAGQPVQDAPNWQTWKPDVDLHDHDGLVPPPSYVPPSVPVPARVVARKKGWGWASLAASIGTMVVLSPFANVFTVLFGGFIVLLVGFVVGLFARRPSWALIVPLLGLLTLLPFARWYSNADVPLNGRSGELILTAADVNADSAERALSAGHIEVDLRGANVARPLKYRIGAGQIEVLVPSNVGYDLRSKVSLGSIRIGGQETAGTSVAVNRTDKPDGALRIVALDLEVGIGDITIVRTEPDLGKS